MNWRPPWRRRPAPACRRRPTPVHVEVPEARVLLALVVNAADLGPGSLRQAILDVNASGQDRTIDFGIVLGAAAYVNVPTPQSVPTGITAGPDGNLWFTEEGASRIARLSPDGTITEFATPTPSSGPVAITAGPDGNLWFTEGNVGQIGRITPAGTITEFPISHGSLPSFPFAITAGPDGNVWFTDEGTGSAGRITPTGTITEFPLSPNLTILPGITTGPDGNLWVTTGSNGLIVRVTPTGTATAFPAPGGPQGITAGPDGNLWFTEGEGDAIGRMTTGGVVTSFPLPTPGASPAGITTGPDGALWFTELESGKVGRITTAGAVSEFPGRSASDGPYAIATGPDGELWVTEQTGNAVARVTADATPTILPATPLPQLYTTGVLVDGTTQPGYAGHPLVAINGARAGVGANGLVVAGGDSTVQGLSIGGFSDSGIVLLANGGNTVRGNYLGINPSGAAAGNTDGLLIADSSDNTVTGNVLSGNTAVGLQILGNATLTGPDITTFRAHASAVTAQATTFGADATNNRVTGNLIGTAPDGVTRRGNGSDGVFINNASANVIGGLDAAARNVISGNGASGVDVSGRLARGNTVLGNFIGTTAGGDAALGNVNIGVLIKQAPANVVGPGNVISGNLAGPRVPNPGATIGNTGAGGVVILGCYAQGNVVVGNRIGTDAAGSAAVPNAYDGVALAGAPGNLVRGNTISGNRAVGVRIAGPYAFGNTVAANHIGTDPAGAARLGNAYDGVYIVQSTGNHVGGATPADGNVIAANGAVGVQIDGPNASGNDLLNNWIGTNPAGAPGLGNALDGVFLNGASGNLVGVSGAGNVIADNGYSGVDVVGPAAISNVIAANVIGLAGAGNAAYGVVLQNTGTDTNVVGGSAPNTIAHNGFGAVFVTGNGPLADALASRRLSAANGGRPRLHPAGHLSAQGHPSIGHPLRLRAPRHGTAPKAR